MARSKAAAEKRRAAAARYKFQSVDSRAVCRALIPRLKLLCVDRLSGRGKFRMRILVADLDKDGRDDVIVRYATLFDCGSHGCATELYQQDQHGQFIKIQDVVSAGDVVNCYVNGKIGISYGDSSHCFLIR
jgi:hypothetical protein